MYCNIVLFLVVVFLRYFCWKFLRRLIFNLFEYHLTSEVDARESLVSPATVISAGRGVLWSDEIHDYKLKIVHRLSLAANPPTNNPSETVHILEQIKNKSRPMLIETKNLKKSYQRICIDEESDLKKKRKTVYFCFKQKSST